MIRLNRDYYQNITQINNNVIKEITSMDDSTAEKYSNSGYILPHMFTYYDKLDLIQDKNNIPIIYHHKRSRSNKKIKYNADSFQKKNCDFSYSTSIPEIDQLDFHRLSGKYWWLDQDTPHRKALRKRKANGWTAIW